MIGWIALQPANSTEAIRRIEYVGSEAWADMRSDFGASETAVACVIKDVMYLGPGGFGRGVLTHEWGHLIQNASSSGYWRQAYGENPAFDRHTKYSRTNEHEGFAESYLAFMAAGGKAPAGSAVAETFEVVRQVIDGL